MKLLIYIFTTYLLNKTTNFRAKVKLACENIYCRLTDLRKLRECKKFAEIARIELLDSANITLSTSFIPCTQLIYPLERAERSL